jgi:hypothetical protein
VPPLGFANQPKKYQVENTVCYSMPKKSTARNSLFFNNDHTDPIDDRLSLSAVQKSGRCTRSAIYAPNLMEKLLILIIFIDAGG